MSVIDKSVFTLTNPTNGNLAFKLFFFENNAHFDHVQRLNHYSIILLQSGSAKLNADFSEYTISDGTMLFFAPYQPFMISSTEQLKGIAILFHSDFYCIHKHQQEIACNGVLFNNIYKPPFINIPSSEQVEVLKIIEQFQKELENPNLAQQEILVAYLKILLIHCSRIKLEQQQESSEHTSIPKASFLIENLKNAIENNFRHMHAPAEYASLLNITTKALARVTKSYCNKTLTDLIGERIIIEAKRELYLSTKPIKAIASELGFEDEYYFSRFFKKNTSVSPLMYRDTVGFGKGSVLEDATIIFPN